MRIKNRIWVLGGVGLLAIAAIVLVIALRPASAPEVPEEPQLAAEPAPEPTPEKTPDKPEQPTALAKPTETKEPAKTEESPAKTSASSDDKAMLSDPLKGIWDNADFDPVTGEWIKDWPDDDKACDAIMDESWFRQALIEGDQESIDYLVKEKGKELPDGYQTTEQSQGMDPHNPAQEAPPPSYQAPDGSGAYDNPNPPTQSTTGEMDPVAAAEGIVVGTEGWSEGLSEADRRAHESYEGLEWG